MLKEYRAILLFNLVYMSAFTIHYVLHRNFEFLLYVGVLLFFFILIFFTLPHTKFGAPILWCLSIWGLLHMAGGGVRIGEGVLYAQTLLPLVSRGELVLLRYDQVVHCFGFAITTWVGFHLLKPHLSHQAMRGVVYLILVGFGMGMGALNEIVEFLATLLLSQTGVGGYVNTALDLVFNFLGSLIAIILIHLHEKTKN